MKPWRLSPAVLMLAVFAGTGTVLIIFTGTDFMFMLKMASIIVFVPAVTVWLLNGLLKPGLFRVTVIVLALLLLPFITALLMTFI